LKLEDTGLIHPDEALRIVLENTQPLPSVWLPLDDVLGHCLAEDIRADRDIPAADRSAMDGYAVRASDVKQCPCELCVVGEVAAGSAARPRVKPGTCARIFTGGNVPPGADTVVMVEETEECGNTVTISTSVKRGENIRKRAEDTRKRATLLKMGTCLGAPQVGVCAAVGKAKLRVHRRPKVTVLCTGEELREVGDKVRPHEIRNSNGPAVCAALARAGFGKVKYRIVPDDPKRLSAQLKRAANRNEVIFLTGGVSVGVYDLVREAVLNLGATIRFHGVAMKPGKPLLYATLHENRHIFGLPGNPISAMFTLNDFALPGLRRMSGMEPEACRPSLWLPLTKRITARPGRMKHLLGRVRWTKDGPCLEPVNFQGSADLVAAGLADGLFAVPMGMTALDAGDYVELRPWRPLP